MGGPLSCKSSPEGAGRSSHREKGAYAFLQIWSEVYSGGRREEHVLIISNIGVPSPSFSKASMSNS